jgi:hypothetical protein
MPGEPHLEPRQPLTAQAGPDSAAVRLAEVRELLRAQDRPGRPLQEAWAELLQPFPFDLWCAGLTFRRWPEKGKGRLERLTPETARAAFEDLRTWLRRREGHWPEGIMVLDYGEVGERLHVHALLAGCAEAKRLSAMDYWHGRYGNARIQEYDRRKGARAYLSRKYLSRKVELEFTPGFDRLAARSGLLRTANASGPLGCA